MMRFTVDRLDHLVITCKDVDITAAWYERVLGMEIEEVAHDGRRIALKFGGQKINLHAATGEIIVPSAARPEPGSADLCFVTAVTPEHVIGQLHDHGVSVELGPVPRTGALGPITSVYCRDPDRNLIEIASYLAM
jgi:catechol 2,3-dioxygenase-like lactoylglutathione lyase family enzyme